MARLFPAMGFLYLHDSAIDLYLKTLREAIATLPREVLQIELNCKPIIIDYTDPREGENSGIVLDSGIVLGYGFHKSDFKNQWPRGPLEGLVFCLNPPHADNVEGVRMYQTRAEQGTNSMTNSLIHSSFMIGPNRFVLTNREFDLDEVVCDVLATKERYTKPQPINTDTFP
jgi:hypothetical protein